MSDELQSNENGSASGGSSIPADAILTASQIKLKERYIIDFSEPIQTLDTNGAKAYKVNDIVDKDKLLFALVCSRETAPRLSILPYLKTLNAPHLLRLIEYGTIVAPGAAEATMVLIYPRPLGGRVIDDMNLPFHNDTGAIQNLFLEILDSLQELKTYGITHRSIRLSNLFYLDETKKNIVLGDCAASFPAFHQPAVYETISSLMADKAGRGNGSEKNDIYALGVMGLFLYLGKGTGLELSAPEILNMKLKKDSYTALCSGAKISGTFSNILRNMLTDTPVQRWNISSALESLANKTGKVTFSSENTPTKKAFILRDQKYYGQTEVAYAIMQSPKEAYELYNGGRLIDWIKTNLENEELALAIDKTVKSTVDNSPNHELSIAKICTYLAPHFPLKLGKICIFPDGLSKAIYYAYRNNLDLNDYARLCSHDVLRLWYLNQEDIRTPAFVNEIRNYVQSQAIGYGIDRVMYEMDEDIPCLSKLVSNDYISTPTRILRTLNNNYNNSQDKPYDNHLIAYLRCKLGKKIDGILIDLNSKIQALEASAILRLYTTMQNKFGPQELPKLSQWLSVFAMPLIKSYHNVKYQKFLEKEILRVNKSGKLYEMQELLENEEARQKDNSEYNVARKTVARLLNEKKMLTANDNRWEIAAKDMAIKGACLLSVVVMIISFVINLFGVLK